MSKVPINPVLSAPPELAAFERAIAANLTRYAQQINASYDGRIDAALSTSSTPATTLSSIVVQKGDFIRNNAVAEAGGAGSKYVILGWVVETAGTAGTTAVFRECRCLTGN